MAGHWFVYDYDSAQTWLAGGRKKYDRPLYTRGLRLQYRGKDIAVRDKWGGFDPILFHPDGTMTIQAPQSTTSWGGSWNPLRSQGVRYVIRQFAGLQDVFQRNNNYYITTANALLTPTKIQKCRTCHGSGKVDDWCNPGYCRANPCEEHPWASHSTGWHYALCAHGNKDSHKVPQARNCYRCSGNGRKDYGNKPISLMWDGSPLRLKDGNPIKAEPTELEKRIAQYVQSVS
jgi:hypothetical protein